VGTYNFNNSSIYGAVGEDANAVFIGGISLVQISDQLASLRDSLIRNGKDDELTINALDDAIIAANNKESDKLPERLKTLGKYIGSFTKEFSIDFLSSALTKMMLG